MKIIKTKIFAQVFEILNWLSWICIFLVFLIILLEYFELGQWELPVYFNIHNDIVNILELVIFVLIIIGIIVSKKINITGLLISIVGFIGFLLEKYSLSRIHWFPQRSILIFLGIPLAVFFATKKYRDDFSRNPFFYMIFSVVLAVESICLGFFAFKNIPVAWIEWLGFLVAFIGLLIGIVYLGKFIMYAMDEHKNQRKILQTGVFLGAIVFVVSFYGFFNAPELNHEWLILSYKYSDYFGLAAGGLIILYYGSLLVTYTPPSSPAPPSHHFSGGNAGGSRGN